MISKRFVKKQQVRWTRRGAHLLLQVRTRVLDDTLTTTFQRWYPGMETSNFQQIGFGSQLIGISEPFFNLFSLIPFK